MTRSIKSRLNRIEKLTLDKKSEEWLAIIRDDNVSVLLIDQGKNIQMTPKEFKAWEGKNPNGNKLTVEWAE